MNHWRYKCLKEVLYTHSYTSHTKPWSSIRYKSDKSDSLVVNITCRLMLCRSATLSPSTPWRHVTERQPLLTLVLGRGESLFSRLGRFYSYLMGSRYTTESQNATLRGVQSRAWRFGIKKHFVFLLKIESKILGRPNPSVVTIPTTPS